MFLDQPREEKYVILGKLETPAWIIVHVVGVENGYIKLLLNITRNGY